jgi:transcriptional regulator with XRE-family HTH domain
LNHVHVVIVLNDMISEMTEARQEGGRDRPGVVAGEGERRREPAALGPALAANARRRREAAGLSLAQLAEQAGIAKGTVSAIEAGEANPTVDTVYALAAALGCPMADLLAGAPDPMLVEVRGGGPPRRIGALEGRLLQRFAPTGPVEVIEVTLTDRATTRSRPHAHGVYEHVWVADGRIELGPADDPFELEAGNYVCFPGWQEHAYRPLAPPVRLLMLLSYVRALPDALAHGDLTA